MKVMDLISVKKSEVVNNSLLVSSDTVLDIDTVMESMNGGYGNYLPFPDKISALLFLLKHSPRPMVCNKMA